MTRHCALACLIFSGLLLASAAGCSGGDSDSEPAPSATSLASQSYPEGAVRLEIEYLDTGLLKGHAYADATEGWVVESIRVEARDHRGAGWPVIEPERTGLGSASASEFFEVTIQELPRGEQVSVTTVVTFRNQQAQRVERTATDAWPP